MNSILVRKRLNIALWIVQVLVALLLFYAAAMKLFADRELLNRQWPWTASHPALVKFTGFVDLAGALGLLLPGLFSWNVRWTMLAAVGIILLMCSAIAFHLSRGEINSVPFNLFMIVCCVFIVWGRRTKKI